MVNWWMWIIFGISITAIVLSIIAGVYHLMSMAKPRKIDTPEPEWKPWPPREHVIPNSTPPEIKREVAAMPDLCSRLLAIANEAADAITQLTQERDSWKETAHTSDVALVNAENRAQELKRELDTLKLSKDHHE